MAKANYRGYLKADAVPLKKYFYVMRPLLAIRWIEAHTAPPPIEFETLLTVLQARPDLLADLSTLLERKKASAEMDVAAPVVRLNQYIEAELDRLETFSKEPVEEASKADLANDLFRSLLAENREPDRDLQPTAGRGPG